MGRPSKEKALLLLFFNEPTRHWRFSTIAQHTQLADHHVSKWLQAFIKRKLITKHAQGYYTASLSPEYVLEKRLFGLAMLHQSGLLSYLARLSAQSVIMFGSFHRGDWYSGSDIDVFLFNCTGTVHVTPYERILSRSIQIFSASSPQTLKKYDDALLRNIITGTHLASTIDVVDVLLHGRHLQSMHTRRTIHTNSKG